MVRRSGIDWVTRRFPVDPLRPSPGWPVADSELSGVFVMKAAQLNLQPVPVNTLPCVHDCHEMHTQVTDILHLVKGRKVWD